MVFKYYNMILSSEKSGFSRLSLTYILEMYAYCYYIVYLYFYIHIYFIFTSYAFQYHT